mmetsp:Transcript_13633/g.34234  ORF Transcript_13633/g.34234 Transcript_13633/m.34234 type:complete len:545 (+) Transcript_13633:96-1730(+)
MVFLVVQIAMLLSVASASEDCPLVIGQTFLAGSTDPTDGSTAWALTSHGIAEKLFTVNQDGGIVGQVAQSIEKLDDLSWEVTLKSDYKFSDGTLVTAENVAAAMTQIDQQNAGNAQASAGSLTWTALDNGNLKVVSERATPVMDAVLAEWCFVVYLVQDEQTIFTGPFAVESFTQGDHFDLIPNTYYSGASDRRPLVIKKYPDGDTVARALKNGDLDMGFHLPATELSDLRQQEGLTIKSFDVGYHYMMWHNTRRSPLSDLQVRKAVDLALDRSLLTQTLLGGDPTRSLFPETTPWGLDESQANSDKSAAEGLLDAAGWTKDASGNRMKDGVQLALDLVAYPQRPGLVLMQPVIKTALTGLGIAVNAIVTDGSSWDALDQIMADKDFDLLMWAQNTLPAGDPQWFLNAFFRSDGGNNHAGLNSSEVDRLLDELAHTESHTERVGAAAAAHQAVLAEVPVSNLMTPAWHVGLSSRLSDYVPWGSDYYVIRADLRPTTVDCPPTTTITTTEAQEADASGAAHVGLRPWYWVAVGSFAVLRHSLLRA